MDNTLRTNAPKWAIEKVRSGGKLCEVVAGEIIVGLPDRGNEPILYNEDTKRGSPDLPFLLPRTWRVLEHLEGLDAIRVKLPGKMRVAEGIRLIRSKGNFAYIEPNHVCDLCSTIPNEYPNIEQLKAAQWALDTIHAPEAWDISTGGGNVDLLVLDTGIAGPERAPQAVYRWWNQANGDHFYTLDPMGESAHGGGYLYEGSPFRLLQLGLPYTKALYRFYLPATGDHLYTLDPNDQGALQAGYIKEGITGGSVADLDALRFDKRKLAEMGVPEGVKLVALHRWYHPGNGDHFYTTDPQGESAPAVGYTYEGAIGAVISRAQSDLSHPDLKNSSRIKLGIDFVHNDNFPVDDHFHGTLVTSIASADTNNRTGMAGLAWNTSVIAHKVFFADETSPTGARGDTYLLANALVHAANHARETGKHVIVNYSGGTPSYSETLRRACAAAGAAGCLVVCAAGNDSVSSSTDPITGKKTYARYVGARYPAALSTSQSHVICVGSVGNTLVRSSFSNVGEALNVVAPGENIYGAYPNYFTNRNPTSASYSLESGTSLACAQVSGLAALIWNKKPELNATQIREIIQATAHDLGSLGWDKLYGHGLIDCHAALTRSSQQWVYRWYRSGSNQHFYCLDPAGEQAPSIGFVYETAAFRTLSTTPTGPNSDQWKPLYRFFNESNGYHFYTTDPNAEGAPNMRQEGNLGLVALSHVPGTRPLFRWWHPSGDHFYTTDSNGELAPQGGYTPENIACYVYA